MALPLDRLVEESGGEATDGVHDESEALHGAEARKIEDRARERLHAAGLSETSADPERSDVEACLG